MKTIEVRGIGWLTQDACGGIRSAATMSHRPGIGSEHHQWKDILPRPFKNFGRLDATARMTVYAVALALRDAGIESDGGKKRDIGIVGANREGSLRTDMDYFRDYVESGRTLSRGNLFIYTLPSSPAGEAAIHFGFLGPLLYVAGTGGGLVPALDTAADIILAGETKVMLAGTAEAGEAVYFVLEGADIAGRAAVCEFGAARTIAQASPTVEALVNGFGQPDRTRAGRGTPGRSL